MVQVLSGEGSLLSQFVAELRDVQLQKDRMRFRRNVERVAEIMAYEISRSLPWTLKAVQTPLGMAQVSVLAEQPVLATVLRAGLPMHQGFLNYFDGADNAFISAYRKYHEDGEFEIEIEYLASPPLNGRILIIVDPMLATGRSLKLTYDALMLKGKPSRTIFAALIASRQGMEYIRDSVPNADIWIAALDEQLNEHAYIVPGLGDAGDLSYGEK